MRSSWQNMANVAFLVKISFCLSYVTNVTLLWNQPFFFTDSTTKWRMSIRCIWVSGNLTLDSFSLSVKHWLPFWYFLQHNRLIKRICTAISVIWAVGGQYGWILGSSSGDVIITTRCADGLSLRRAAAWAARTGWASAGLRGSIPL